MIKRYFKDWTKFELVFLICGLTISIASSVIFKGTIIDTLYTSLYLITVLLMSKGKVECYFVGVVSVFFYAIVSYNQGYYGDTALISVLIGPILLLINDIYGSYNWIRMKKSQKEKAGIA